VPHTTLLKAAINRNMADILFLTQRIPWPPIKGEKIRPGQIIRHFAKSYRVFLGTLIDDPEDEQYASIVEGQVHEAFFGRIDRRMAYLKSLTGLLTGEPLSFKFYWDRALARWVQQMLDRIKPEVVFVCSSNMMPYLAGARHRPRVLVVDFADVDSEKWRAYAEDSNWLNTIVYRREWHRTRAAEIAIARDVDWVTFVTAEEKALFDQVAPGFEAKTRGLLSGVDAEFFAPDANVPNALTTTGPNFVFTGTMDYPPNEQAVVWFANEILPLIRRQYADTAFYVVGNRPSAPVQALASRPGVTVTGRVPDVRDYLAYCTAAVAPLRIARGIQNKVLEAMAMGVPIVGTEGAITGINAEPGRHLLQAETPQAFADACIRLIQSPETANELGAAARRLIDDGWSWDARLEAFDALIAAPSDTS
jgi:polysaccharide biosynthesis protein PslH